MTSRQFDRIIDRVREATRKIKDYDTYRPDRRMRKQYTVPFLEAARSLLRRAKPPTVDEIKPLIDFYGVLPYNYSAGGELYFWLRDGGVQHKHHHEWLENIRDKDLNAFGETMQKQLSVALMSLSVRMSEEDRLATYEYFQAQDYNYTV